MKGFRLSVSLIITALLLVNCAGGGGPVAPGDYMPPVWDTTTGVTSVVPGENQVTVIWGTATDAMTPPVEYLVYIDEDEDPWDQSPVLKPSNDPHVFSNLDNGTEYWCGVRSRDSADPPNVEKNDVVISATPEGQVTLDTSPPVWDDTVGVVTVVKGEGSVTVEWGTATDAESPPVDYLVYVDEDDEPWDMEPMVFTTNDPYTFTDLFSNIDYHFGVRCRDSAVIPNSDSNENFLVSETIPRGWTLDWGHGYFLNEDVQIDSTGNIIIMGETKWGIDFDPGEGHSSHGGNIWEDVFVLKLNPDLEFQWAGIMLNGGESSQVSKIGFCIDSFDYIYVLFFETFHNETYLLKVDNEGNLLWEKVLYTFSEPTAGNKAITVDGNNDIYITGYFKDTVDFNPGSGEDIYTSIGGIDCFLVKFDSSGVFKWVITWGGIEYEVSRDLAIDSNGNIYAGGFFEDTVDFDPGPGTDNHTSNGLRDAFLSSFDPDGNFRWARTWGGIESDSIYHVIASSSGIVYVAGNFYNQVDFNPGPDEDIHTATEERDSFLCRYDSSGAYKFVYQWNQLGMTLCFDEYHNLYMGGLFYEDVDLDPGEGINFHVAAGTAGKSYLSKFNPSGEYSWSRVWEGLDSGVGVQGIAIDGDNNVYVVGAFWGPGIDFDPGPGVDVRDTGSWPFYNLDSVLYLSKFPPDGYW